MTHTTLRIVTLKDDPSEQVIWNQERPIAYLNKADASIDEFIELENMIQAVPELLQACNDALFVLQNRSYADSKAVQDTLDDILSKAIRKAKA